MSSNLFRTIFITACAIVCYFGLRALPSAIAPLHHADFNTGDASFLELCEPGSPQFVPVRTVPSPVRMQLQSAGPSLAGSPHPFSLTLTTSEGRPIRPRDLLVVHEERLHLLIIDDSLRDYHHVHPLSDGDNTYHFSFTPRYGGRYSFFADFTPLVTGRGIYALAEWRMEGAHPPPVAEEEKFIHEMHNVRYSLRPSEGKARAGQIVPLEFQVEDLSSDSPIALEKVMGALAHLVAFDLRQTGFAHLHPEPAEEGTHRLRFRWLPSTPGWYVFWAQVRIQDKERFAPFVLQVFP